MTTCLGNDMDTREDRGMVKYGKCKETGHSRGQCLRDQG